MDFQNSNLSIKSEDDDEEEEDTLLFDNAACMYYGSHKEEDEKRNQDLFDLLKNWNQLELFEHFTNEKIDLEVLAVIKPHHFERLLEPFNLRTHIMFEYNLEQWRDSIGLPLPKHLNNLSNFRPYRQRRNSIVKHLSYHNFSNSRTSSNMSKCLAKELTSSVSNSVTKIVTPILTEETVTSTPTTSTATTTSNSTPTENPSNKITLEHILKTTIKGKMLIDIYEKNKKFEESQRTLLIHLIAEYFNDKGIHLELSATYNIEKEIISKFPSEQLEFYRTSKRGRIYNKYCNYKYSLIKVARNSFSKAIPNSSTVESEAEAVTNFVPEDDAEKYLKLLKNDKLPPEQVENCWKACTRFRINEIRKNSVAFIFKKWPQYKSPNGYKYIAMDYKYLEPNWNSLVTNWDSISDKLFTFLRTGHTIKSYEIRSVLNNINEIESKDIRDASLMWCLHGYLKPTLRTSGTDDEGKKFFSKISIKDSQDSFIYVAKSLKDIEMHKTILNQQYKRVDPFIAVLGTNIMNFKEIFVCIEDVMYNMESFIGALDLCYSIIVLLKLEHPTACKAIWSFIQNIFFETKPKTHFPRVHVLINELKNK